MSIYQKWIEAKAAEREATAARVKIEEEIIFLHPAPEEGQKTYDLDGFKLTVKQDITRKLDEKAWELVKDQIPEKIRPVEYVEMVKLDANGVKWLRVNEPGYYKIVAQCVTEKPNKINIKIERT